MASDLRADAADAMRLHVVRSGARGVDLPVCERPAASSRPAADRHVAALIFCRSRRGAFWPCPALIAGRFTALLLSSSSSAIDACRSVSRSRRVSSKAAPHGVALIWIWPGAWQLFFPLTAGGRCFVIGRCSACSPLSPIAASLAYRLPRARLRRRRPIRPSPSGRTPCLSGSASSIPLPVLSSERPPE